MLSANLRSRLVIDLESEVIFIVRRSFAAPWYLLIWHVLIGLALLSSAHATEPTESPVGSISATDVEPADESDDEISQAVMLQAQPPLVPPRPLQPTTPVSGPAAELAAQLFGPGGISRSLLSQDRRDRATGPSTDVVLGLESTTRVSSDTGSLLGKSPSSTNLGIQRRTPIVTDPRVRGSSAGQQLASGSFWFPARQDLDTLLSKIDSRIVQDVIVVKGPYSSLYGPGFSFYDVELVGAPRYPNGMEWHGSTGVDYHTNGQPWYGRQDLWGGGPDWGFRVGYGHGTGNDYETGNGTDIPSSYKSRDLIVALGMDLSPDSHLEFSYLRLDQTDVEYPGELFDMTFLVTDAFDLKYILENQCYFDRLTVETWYNRTRFEGNSQRSGKRRQIPLLNDLQYLGFTDADNMSTGFSLATTWGEPGWPQLTLGVDLRYLHQSLNEFDISPFFNTSFAQHNFNFPIPPAHLSDPGLFLQQVLPVSDRLAIKGGARMDWVSTNAARFVDNADPDGDGQPDNLSTFLGGGFNQHFFLWSAYLTAEFQINDHWATTGGVGYARRPPTMTELYAVGTALAILQQGLTFVTGNPNLDMERLWQIDLGLKADYGRFRGGINGFYAWIHDYITYATTGFTPGFGFVEFVNTDWATLSGGEVYGEYNWNCWMTPFATMSYTEGRDHTRDSRGVLGPPDFPTFSHEEPLPGIAPLESRLGIRFHEPGEKPCWTVEFSARVVDEQDRVASSLLEQRTPGFTTYDLRGYWQATQNLLLVAGVENFTDKQYREHLDLRTGLGVFQPGISFYFGLQLTY